ncbi:MAG: 50S ribosomal protein L10 [Patescibacteria group bacterium]|nr:50S ribosomal protein L10 [Patescibacteria group bacterium]
MAISRQQKEQILASLTDEFTRAKSVTFLQNNGIDVADLTALRRSLRAEGGSLTVAKKTLIRKAAESANVSGVENLELDGAIAVAFSYDDEVAGARVSHTFAKGSEDLAQIMGGVVEGKALSSAEAKQLATLPTREELLGKMMGSMTAPLSGFVGVGNQLVSGLVRTLDQVAKQKA